MSKAIGSYPKIYNLGHQALANLFSGPVIVEEKVDGSQFSFGKGLDGTLHARSKNQEILSENMFDRAMATVRELAPLLTPGWTYRGEYLRSPHHNTLTYDRVPAKHIILFDIEDSTGRWLSPGEKAVQAARLGLEVVPTLFTGRVKSAEDVKGYLTRTSILGGQKIEGVVLKPEDYNLWGRDAKVLMGKFVREEFKEKNMSSWRRDNPTQGDILTTIAAKYKCEPRWLKAVQHLRDDGKLECSPRDIGALMRAIPEDIEGECADEIKGLLWQWAWPHIRRHVTHGLPEWYKERLLEQQFAKDGVGQ